LVVFFLAQHLLALHNEHEAALSLRRSGCVISIQQSWLSRAVGPIFERVEGIRISSEQFKQRPEWALQQLHVFGYLKRVSLVGLEVKDLSFLEHVSQLTSLSIVNGNLTDERLVHLRSLKRLVHLDLSFNPIRGHGLEYLVGSCPLKTLYVARTKLEPGNIAVIARFNGLEDLILDGTPIDDRALSGLGGLKNLRVLEVNETQVGTGSLRWASAMEALETLILYKTKVGDGCVEELVKLKMLTLLDVRETNVTDEGVTRLEEANPQLTVLH